MLGLVAAGLGVTIYPECVVDVARRGIAVRPIHDVDARVETAMARRETDATPVAARFVDFAVDRFAAAARETPQP